MARTRRRLTWAKEPHLSGLSGVGQFAGRERGWLLHYGGERIGTVSQLDRRYHRVDPALSWGWSVCWDKHGPNGELIFGVPLYNTWADPEGVRYATADEAKAACLAYARKHLAAANTAKE